MHQATQNKKMASRQDGKAPPDSQQDAKVKGNIKRDQNKQQKHNDD